MKLDIQKNLGGIILIGVGISLLIQNFFGYSLFGGLISFIVNLFTSFIGLIVKISLFPIKLMSFGFANMGVIIGIVLIIMGLNYLRKMNVRG